LWAGGTPQFHASYAAIAFDNPFRPDLTWQAQFRINGSSGAFKVEANRPIETPPPDLTVFTGGALPGQVWIFVLFSDPATGGDGTGAVLGNTYEVQLRSVSAGGFFGPWSASMVIALPPG